MKSVKQILCISQVSIHRPLCVECAPNNSGGLAMFPMKTNLIMLPVNLIDFNYFYDNLSQFANKRNWLFYELNRELAFSFVVRFEKICFRNLKYFHYFLVVALMDILSAAPAWQLECNLITQETRCRIPRTSNTINNRVFVVILILSDRAILCRLEL